MTGVRIIQVVQGGSARRRASSRNDTILAVNGFQVGYVNGTLYDTSSEFDGWRTGTTG